YERKKYLLLCSKYQIALINGEGTIKCSFHYEVEEEAEQEPQQQENKNNNNKRFSGNRGPNRGKQRPFRGFSRQVSLETGFSVLNRDSRERDDKKSLPRSGRIFGGFESGGVINGGDGRKTDFRRYFAALRGAELDEVKLTVHSIWKELNGRRHGEVPIPSSHLTRGLDKQTRNRISSIRELGDRRYEG
ncbi:unnamed protein product, partial [Arabidopsis halleri]